MRNRLPAGVLVGVLLMTTIPAQPAEAGCRPTTLADLFPEPPPPPPLSESEATDLLGSSPPPAETATPPPAAAPPVFPACRFVYRMLHPVNGPSQTISGFGAVRPGERKHQGVDLIADKLTPVVAVRDGVVFWVLDEAGLDCCALAVRHDDGWSSWYIHLNNDMAGSDDGRALGIAPGIALGSRVGAGQVIGWVGDSGNAEPGPPHLHFELRTPWGVAVDPFPSLWAALRRVPDAQPDADIDYAGPFLDDDRDPAAFAFALLTSLGATVNCDHTGVRACPDRAAIGAELVDWTRVASGAGASDVSSLVAAGYVPLALAMSERLGEDLWCATFEFCVDRPVTWSEAIAYITAVGGWADPHAPGIQLPELAGAVPCTDPVGNPSRAELAQLIARAFGYLPALPCDRLT